MAKKLTAGQRMIASAKQALAFAQGENNACVVHIPRRDRHGADSQENQNEPEPVCGVFWRKRPDGTGMGARSGGAFRGGTGIPDRD